MAACKRAVAALGLFLALILSRQAATASEAPRLVVEAPARYEGLARELEALPGERLEAVTRLVGLTDPGPPIRVLLAPEGSDLAQVPAWVAGYARGNEGMVVLLPARTPSYPDSSFEDLLRHEVAHVLVDRAARGRPLPRWFHEGVAMIAGGSWGLEDRSYVAFALLTESDVSLTELDRRFSRGQGEVNKAYAVAGDFVRGLFEEHGPEVAADILAGVRHGLTFDEAFAHATGTSLAAAEAAFHRRQSIWYRWVPILTSSVTLWLAITLLALVAIRRRRVRDAAKLKRWEEEERLAEAAASEPIN